MKFNILKTMNIVKINNLIRAREESMETVVTAREKVSMETVVTARDKVSMETVVTVRDKDIMAAVLTQLILMCVLHADKALTLNILSAPLDANLCAMVITMVRDSIVNVMMMLLGTQAKICIEVTPIAISYVKTATLLVKFFASCAFALS